LALAPKFRTKNACVNVDEIDTRGRFHQHRQFLLTQIPKAQKDTGDFIAFLHFWVLGAEKLLVMISLYFLHWGIVALRQWVGKIDPLNVDFI